MTTDKPKKRMGFASMTPERRREIAQRGGQTAHKNGLAHKWTSDTGRAAGRLGGIASRKKKGQ